MTSLLGHTVVAAELWDDNSMAARDLVSKYGIPPSDLLHVKKQGTTDLLRISWNNLHFIL